MYSEDAEILLSVFAELLNNQVSTPYEIQLAVNEHFWELFCE